MFSAYLMHAPLTNTTDRIRMSSDTRYQRASEPQDQRHMGDTPDEFHRNLGEKSMREACEEWGIDGMLGSGEASRPVDPAAFGRAG